MSRPATARDACLWANSSPPKACWYSSSSGHVELALTLEDARSASHSGSCDGDIAALREVPYIKEQLEQVSPKDAAMIVKETGAWDDSEAADHDANLDRVLWFACCDITEENVE